VAEWVNDWFRKDYYSVSPRVNPQGPTEEEATLYQDIYHILKPFRVLRDVGGCKQTECPLSKRSAVNPELKNADGTDVDAYDLGFRLVLDAN